MTDTEAFLAFYEASRKHLSGLLAGYNERLTDEDNALLKPFLNSFAEMNEGGKLLRGMLVHLGASIGGIEDMTASDPLALAFEVFQTAVLIHDDVIDRAEYRRDKQTIHRRYEDSLKKRGIPMAAEGETEAALGQAAAICVGDLGLYKANRLIAEAYRNSPKAAQLILYFDDVIIDTIRGELLDVVLPCELSDPVRSKEEADKLLVQSVFEIYRLKTALYSVTGPVHLGMLLGTRSDGEMRLVDQMTEKLGVAFQIRDDILGIYGSAEEMGKDVGSDVEEFKQTILYMYTAAMTKDGAASLQGLYGKKDVTEDDLGKVREIFRESGALAYAEETMEDCFKEASDMLSSMSFLSEDIRKILSGFIAYLRDRTK
jgi:geranylgeranyl diphosphate synthase type I